MATRYVRSTDGSNSDTGATWALAKANLNGGANGDAAGDIIYVSHVHSETAATSIFFDWAGSAVAPVKVICGNDAAEPPTTAATSAIVGVTGAASEIQISGSHYCYGISYINDGSGAANIWLHNGSDQAQLWDSCSFQINSATASNLYINATTTSTGHIRWKNCTVKFGAAGSRIVPQADRWVWEGGSVLSGSTGVDGLLTLSQVRFSDVHIHGVDFSNLDSAFYVVGATGGGHIVLRNCKLPAAWSGGLFNGTFDFSGRIEMYNCDSGATNYRVKIQAHSGILDEETTIVRASGASNGFTAYSLKMVGNANCNPTYGEFQSPEISVWNDIVASSVTVSIDICHDSVTALTNDEVRLDVEYLGSASAPLASFATSGIATPLTAATTPSASTNTWTTTGLTNPNKQTLSVTITPQQRGYIHCRVSLLKASYTIYVDPRVQFS